MSRPENTDTHVPNSLEPSPEQIIAMGQLALQVMADYYGALPNLPIFHRSTARVFGINCIRTFLLMAKILESCLKPWHK